MKRRLFNLFTLLTLLLSVAVCVAWVRSFWACDDLTVGRGSSGGTGRSYVAVFQAEGRVVLKGFTVGDAGRGQALEVMLRRYPPHSLSGEDNPETLARGLGFGLVVEEGSYWFAWAPHWFLAPIAAVVPAIWCGRWARRRSRRGRGVCPSCGYDLRGAPGRCPECGSASGPGPAAG